MILYKIQAVMMITAMIGLGHMAWHTMASCDGMPIKMLIISFYILVCAVAFGAIRQMRREAQEKQ